MMLSLPSSIKRIILALGILIFLGGVVWFASSVSVLDYAEAHTIGKNVGSFQELSDKFRTLAQEKGGVYAYEVLKRASLPPQTDLHLLGHAVGEELYAQEGMAGIRACTPDFRNACSHSIVVGALAEFGEEALPDIRDACREAPGGSGAYTMCFHGLGHGVLAGYGYELEPTIDFCKLTGTTEHNEREYIECFGGSIMELVGGGGHDTHLWEEARDMYLTDPLAPCTTDVVPNELKEICLVYLTPEIWARAGIELGAPDEKKFNEAFSYCDYLPIDAVSLRKACYSGFGKEFVPLAGARDIRDISSYSNGEFARAISWCGYAGNEQGEEWCISEGLDSVFWGGENDPEASFRYCSIVTDTTSNALGAACYQRLSSNIEFYIQDAKQKAELCSRIPESLNEPCRKP